MATPIKDKLVNLEILKSSQDYIDNKKINKNQGTQNNGKFMRVGADGNLVPDNVPIPDVSGQIKEHNENTDSHQDIRTELKKKANSGTTLSDYGITDAVPDSHLTDSKAHEDIRKETAKLKEDLGKLSGEIDDASNGNIPFTIIPNKFYNPSGLVSYDGWSASEYIDIKDMAHIYTNWSKTSAYNIFVDSEFNVIGGKVFTIKEGFQKTEVPEGACYVGISNESAIMEEFVIWSSVKTMAYDNTLEISELKKDIPTYYEEHVVEKIDLIREKETHSGVNGDEFIFITDYHMNVNANNSPLLINRLLKETGVHKTVFGGDIYGGYTTKEEALDVIADFYELFDKIKMFSIVGNHEYNNPSSRYPERQLSEGQVCSMVTLQNELMYSDRFIENYIIHNHTNKTMYLFVGCSYNSSISYESYNWVLNALKKNKGYNIIVFSHIGLDNNGENGKVAGISGGFTIISRGLDSFNAKTTYTYRGITYDYSDCEGEVICAFTGHNHVDGCIQTDGGINVISTTCDSYGEPEGGVIRTKGTVTEQAFDVINIDYDSRKIYMTRIGAGSDREFDY